MVLTVVNYFLDYLGYQLEPLPSSTSSSNHEDQKRKVQVELGQRKKRRSSVDARSRESSGEARSSKWNLWEPNINFAGKDIVLVKESNDASQELEEKNPEKIISLSDSFQKSLSLDVAPSASQEQITTVDSGDEDIKQDVILVSEVHYSTKDVAAEDDTRAATPEVAVDVVEDEDKTSPLTDRTNTSSDALVSEVHYTTTQHRTPTKEIIKLKEHETEENDCKASEVEKSKEMPGAESLKLNKASDDQDPGASSQNKKQGKENSRSFKGQGNNRNKNRSSGSKAKNKRKGF